MVKPKGELAVGVPEEMLTLTEKQRKFCEIYVSRDDLTIRQCSKEAGYNANMGADLVKHPAASAYIKKLRNELNAKYEVTFENHVRKLAEIRDIALQNGAYAAAVTAEKHRGQVAGLYIDRKEILHGRLDQMSREDVLKEIEKLKQEFPGLSTIWETNKVIEHSPISQGENDKEAGKQVQQAAGDSH
jgi:phage terminase small subunit